MAAREHFDLIVLGAGSGNMLPDRAFHDWKVAICESGKFGGTCLNVGCIPTKMYVYAADVASTIASSSTYGIDSDIAEVDWPAIRDRVFARIDPSAESAEAYRRGPRTPNVTVFDGEAHFTGPHTIATADGDTPVEITGDVIVIATGSRPMILPVVADSGITYHTNETIMRLPRLPKEMIIAGAGSVGLEFAHVFSSLGTTVHLINRSETLLHAKLPAADAERLTRLAGEQWDLHVGRTITSLTQSTSPTVTATLDDGTVLMGEVFLAATGRVPNGDRLNLDAAGIDHDGSGRVLVDTFGRTNVPGVWALGDASNTFKLKHVANAEMRAIHDNILAADAESLTPLPHTHVPWAVFTHPQIAGVGLTPEQAAAAGWDVVSHTQEYSTTAYGWAMEDTTSVCTITADRTSGQILGCTILGPQASTLIQTIVTAMVWQIPYPELARGQYWIHPALPEVVENCLLGLAQPTKTSGSRGQ
ncbi:MAG: mycothione reductase [Corynebacterium sp.]|nr:mycothione reductase [Corynebacterium sp.]